ncbi:fimbrial protein [Rahnella sp. PCH160]|uniref:fimbrial protein n=1 Tax=Rahnella sp. PCH160 TaxID=3447928 RepID=UPI0039FC32C7
MKTKFFAIQAGICLAVNLFLSPFSWAENSDNWNVEGMHGELNISGIMTEAPCAMDMTSNFQEIELGNLNNSQFIKPGDQGKKIDLIFKLHHCIVSQSRLQNLRSGAVSWSSDQPLLYMEFVSKRSDVNPDLVELKGVRGLGLRIFDENLHAIPLGKFSAPHFLNSGQNILKYSVAFERTAEKVTFAPFQATIDFRMYYY